VQIIPLKETAQLLSLSPLSLADKRFRLRIGLPAIKLGRRLGFDERDIEKLILRGREVHPHPNELVGAARTNEHEAVEV
jgi:hypothetical protein